MIKMKTLSIGRLHYDINLLMDTYPTEGSTSTTKEMIACSGGSAGIVAYALGKWNYHEKKYGRKPRQNNVSRNQLRY